MSDREEITVGMSDREEILSAMCFLDLHPGLKEYVKNFDHPMGFLWTKSEELTEIKLALANDTNSPSSLALVLRECSARLNL